MPTGLPPGVGIGPSTGVIAGTPTESGVYSFTAQIKDARGQMAQLPVTLTVRAVQPIAGYLPGEYVAAGYYATASAAPFPLDYWTVVFARPQMASYTKVGAEDYALSLCYATSEEVISLLWESEDTVSHPLCSYATVTDYTGYVWRFTVSVSTNIREFDATNGLTLTVELAGGASYIVRVWNYYVSGTSRNATFELDFSSIAGGFGATQPFTADSVTRMFFTFTHEQYGSTVKFSDYDQGSATITTVSSTGNLSVREASVPSTGIGIALGYDDLYNQSPTRIVDSLVSLGYVRRLTCYVGMSHFPRLGWDATEARFRHFADFGDADGTPPNIDAGMTGPANYAAMQWLQALRNECRSNGIQLILSLSYELFWDYCPLEWAQRNLDGEPAQTGYTPPSTLLAFTRPDVMTFLKTTAEQMIAIYSTSAAPYSHPDEAPYFQIGEPWWWDGSFSDGKPCFYDDYTQALFTSEVGGTMYEFTASSDAVPAGAATTTANWLRDKLGDSTLAIRDYLQSLETVYVGVLLFTPQVYSSDLMEAANYPLTDWDYPGFNFFQLEAYDRAIEADQTEHNAQIVQALDDLDYPLWRVEYFGGYVEDEADAAVKWPRIITATNYVIGRGVGNVLLWSYSQVTRDGLLVLQA